MLLRVVAVVGAGLLSAVGAAGTAAAAEQPSAYVVPNPSGTGQQVTLVGRGFCGAASCSRVTVTVEWQTVASDVPVRSDGTFAAQFQVGQPPGEYQVTATQQTSTGEKSAQARMIVAPRDTPPSQTSGGTGVPKQGRTGATSAGPSVDNQRNIPSGGQSGTAGGSSTAARKGRAGWLPWLAAVAGLVLLAGVAMLVWRVRQSRAH